MCIYLSVHLSDYLSFFVLKYNISCDGTRHAVYKITFCDFLIFQTHKSKTTTSPTAPSQPGNPTAAASSVTGEHFTSHQLDLMSMFRASCYSALLSWKEGRKEMCLVNDALNTFYLRLYGRKEGNVLFKRHTQHILFTVIWKEGRKCFI